MDDPMQASMSADLEVERWLSDFARARLTPSAASKARSRARVMREARLAFADQAGQAAAAADREVVRLARRRKALRRAGALAFAAALSLIAVGGALAASTAGGPLYGARVWLETVTLPADGSGRAAAEIARLEARMAELEAAVASGDRVAAAAALEAYEQIADEALLAAGTDVAAIDRLEAAFDRHIAVLRRVADQVPPQAAESINRNIERAIDHNDAAIQRIQAIPSGGGNGVEPNVLPGAQPGAQPATQPGKSAGPATPATPEPAAAPPATAAPADATSEPTPKVPPAKPTQRPDKTPPGKSSH
jgi:hypothetical protein